MFLNLLKNKIPFDQYMAQALYHPQLGYYSTQVNFGAAGDFVTAPTLTPAFAQALGRFLLTQKQDAIIELGPGNGQLAYDLLLFLDQHQYLPNQYYLVEASHHLKEQQQQKLNSLPKDLFDLVQWVEFKDLKDLDATVLANEFFDALPVVRFKIIDGKIKEAYIHAEEDKLIESYQDPRPELVSFYQELDAQGIYLEENYASELCLQYAEIAQALNQALRKGLLLIIDYGYPRQEYYQPMRTQGTLQIYSEHQASNDYLENPGTMDITAHVDFSHLAQTLITAGFQFEAFTYQNVFLLEQDINVNLETLSVSEQQKIKRLLDSALMGEAFKVLIMSKAKAIDYKPSYDLTKFL